MGNGKKTTQAKAGNPQPQGFLALLEVTSDVVLLLDARWEIRASSRRAQVAFGLPPDDSPGLPLGKFLTSEKDKAILRGLLADSTMDKSRHQTIGFRQVSKDLLYLDVHMKPLGDEGRNKGWILLVGKSTPPPVASGDSARYASLLDRMMRNYSAPIFLIDPPSGTITDCNQAAVSALGYPKEELRGRTLDSLGENGLFAEETPRERRFAYSTSGIFQSKTRLRRKDKAVLSFSFTSLALFDGRGRMETILCVLHDRSEQEARRAQLLNMAEDVEIFSRRFRSVTAGLMKKGKSPTRLSDLGLGRRQIEIIRLVATGHPTKQIASILNLAEATIKGHLSQIYRSMDVTSRIDLLRLIYEKGYRIE